MMNIPMYKCPTCGLPYAAMCTNCERKRQMAKRAAYEAAWNALPWWKKVWKRLTGEK